MPLTSTTTAVSPAVPSGTSAASTTGAGRDHTRLLGFPAPGRRAVVVGGGPLAARRAAALTRASTPVAVFAPALCDDLFDLLAERLVTWENRWPTPADLGDAWLVHAATGDPERDARVCTWAREPRTTSS